MDVGFIGLGKMGAGMAANLLRAGHRVTVWNRTREREKPLLDLGAHAAGTVADACGGDAVVTMLADDAAVEAVALGADAIVATLRPGAVHVSMSTIGIATAERLTAAHRDADSGSSPRPCSAVPRRPPPRSCTSSRPARRTPSTPAVRCSMRWDRACSGSEASRASPTS